MNRARTLSQWKSPPTPSCSSWTSCDRKSSLDPPIEWSVGLLKSYTYTVSARISGVKNFESQKISFVRGLPFSQVQSASEKGSIFAGAAASAVLFADVADSAVVVTGAAGAALNGATGTVAFALVAGVVGRSGALAFFSSASSSSMRFRIASNSLAIAGGICWSALLACWFGVSPLLCAKQGNCPSAKITIAKTILAVRFIKSFNMEVISCSRLCPAFFDLQNLCAALCAASPAAARFVRKKSPEIPGAYHPFGAGAFLPARIAPARTGKTRTPLPPPKKQKLPSNRSFNAPAGFTAHDLAEARLRIPLGLSAPDAHPPRSFASIPLMSHRVESLTVLVSCQESVSGA